jgi:hypothetical protein
MRQRGVEGGEMFAAEESILDKRVCFSADSSLSLIYFLLSPLFYPTFFSSHSPFPHLYTTVVGMEMWRRLLSR